MHKLLFLAAAVVRQAIASPLPAPMLPSAAWPQEWLRYSVWTTAGPASPLPQAFSQLNLLIQARHRISKEDSIASIARRYNTDVRSLQSTNQNEFVVLRPGGYIRVLNKKGYLYEVTAKSESLDSIIGGYGRGKNRADFKRSVIDTNNLPPSALLADFRLEKGARILLPDVYAPVDGYHIPMEGGFRISSGFGYRRHPLFRQVRKHQGIDIAKPWGEKVYPSRSGRVVFAGWEGGYGNMVEIEHPNGESTRYGHLSKITVKTGDAVSKDKTLIGNVGDTGWTTGPHLHFEIRDRHGRPVNPLLRLGKH